MEKKQKALSLQVISCLISFMQKIVLDNFYSQVSLIKKWIKPLKQTKSQLSITTRKWAFFPHPKQKSITFLCILLMTCWLDNFSFDECFLQEHDPSVLCFLKIRLSIRKVERQRTTRRILFIHKKQSRDLLLTVFCNFQYDLGSWSHWWAPGQRHFKNLPVCL